MPTPTDLRITAILKALRTRGESLHNFQAHLVVRVDHLRTAEKDMNLGHIWYQRRRGETRFDIRFNTLVVDGAIAKRHADHDIVFDGRWLIDRNGSAKIFRKIEIAPPGHKFNPLRLGQGPIPIPIGQKPAEVEKEFHLRLLANKTMPPHTVGLRLIPRDKAEFTFVKVDFWIDTKTWLPVKIVRTAPDGTPTTAALSKIVINRALHHHFHLSPPESGWTVEIRHYHKN
ncbi:MAG: LolA family protein [Phycisphaerae bacterium]